MPQSFARSQAKALDTPAAARESLRCRSGDLARGRRWVRGDIPASCGIGGTSMRRGSAVPARRLVPAITACLALLVPAAAAAAKPPPEKYKVLVITSTAG